MTEKWLIQDFRFRISFSDIDGWECDVVQECNSEEEAIDTCQLWNQSADWMNDGPRYRVKKIKREEDANN